MDRCSISAIGQRPWPPRHLGDTFDATGNQTLVQEPTAVTTMQYDKENRLALHQNGGVTTTYLYNGDGRKRIEQVAAGANHPGLGWPGLS